MTEFQRALSDLEEVRDRLSHVQCFEGYSAPAAVASGIAAIAAGLVQWRVAPLPRTPGELHAYLLVWMLCLAVALGLNYGAVAVWLLKNRGPGAHSRFRSAASSIAPSVVFGGVLTAALVNHGAYALLPGTWFAFYAIGLFASHASIPNSTMAVRVAFGAFALAFLTAPLERIALSWWVMTLAFGAGQIAIGYLVWRSRPA